jgi:hypothetical protein
MISSTGDVLSCSVRSENFGNVRDNDYDLMKILNTKKAKIIRKKLKNCYCNDAGTNYTNIMCNPSFILRK